MENGQQGAGVQGAEGRESSPGPAGAEGLNQPAEAGGGESGPANPANGRSGASVGQQTPGQAGPADGRDRHQWAPQPLPPGYVLDPATGNIVFVGPVFPQQPVYPGFQGYAQAESPEQAAARQAAEQQRYGRIVHSFEQFLEGDATVSDVVKTLYAATAHNDQLWKGAMVGAAAAVLLTSKPVRQAMGKTFGAVFPGLKPGAPASGKAPDPSTPRKE